MTQKVLNENKLHYSFEKLLLSAIRFWNQKYSVLFKKIDVTLTTQVKLNIFLC